jgi:hypothetical protein
VAVSWQSLEAGAVLVSGPWELEVTTGTAARAYGRFEAAVELTGAVVAIGAGLGAESGAGRCLVNVELCGETGLTLSTRLKLVSVTVEKT